MARILEGSPPAATMRRASSLRLKPASTSIASAPDSTRIALPRLPEPRTVSRTADPAPDDRMPQEAVVRLVGVAEENRVRDLAVNGAPGPDARAADAAADDARSRADDQRAFQARERADLHALLDPDRTVARVEHRE